MDLTLKILRRTMRPGYSSEGASKVMNAKAMIKYPALNRAVIY